MKHLKKVAQIVSLKKIKKAAIFNHQFPKQKGSKFNILYQALTQHEIESDADAAPLLYENASPKDDRYRQLKSRFKKRLFNTLLLTDVATNTAANYEKAYIQSTKEWAQVKILQHYDTELACYHARSLLSTAIKFKLTDYVIHCARLLGNNASSTGDIKQFQYYQNCLQEYRSLLEIELKAAHYYHYSLLHLNHTKTASDEILIQIRSYYAELRVLCHQYDSPLFQLYYHLLAIILQQKLMDYFKVIHYCNSLEAYFKQHPTYTMPSKLFFIAQQKLLAYLYLQDNANAKIQITHYLSIFEQKKQWLDLQEKSLLIALHSQQYSTAFQSILAIRNHKHCQNLTHTEQQKWVIFELYTAYTQLTKLDTSYDKRKFMHQWQFVQLLQNDIEYDKEHRSLALLQIIIKILIAVELHDEETAANGILELKYFSARHLKQPEHYRHIQYCRLLQQLAKAQFIYEQIGMHQKYLIRLKNTPFRLDNTTDSLEIIPYSQLWQMTLASCAAFSVSRLV